MTWNYRVCKHVDKYDKKCYPKKYWGKTFTWYAVHEVYYRKNGKPFMVTLEPIKIIGDRIEDVKDNILLILKDTLLYPVIDFNSIGKKKRKKKK